MVSRAEVSPKLSGDGFFYDQKGLLAHLGQPLTLEEVGLLSCYVGDGILYPREHVDGLAIRAARASGRKLDFKLPFRGCKKEELAVVLNTARLASKIKMCRSGPASIGIKPEPGWACRSAGLLHLDFVWQHAGRPTRLLEIGFFVDAGGNLVVPSIHRHLLGFLIRSQIEEMTSGSSRASSLFEEKKRGDSFYSKFRKKTGLQVEIFGLLAAVMVFGPHLQTNQILFYGLEDHPSYSMTEYFPGVRERMDFAGMLGQIGVDEQHFYRDDGLFFSVPIEAIEAAFETNFPAAKECQRKYKDALLGLRAEQE